MPDELSNNIYKTMKFIEKIDFEISKTLQSIVLKSKKAPHKWSDVISECKITNSKQWL